VHLLVRRHFENKNNTAPHGHILESDQANRADVADRGTCDLAVFGTILCPGGCQLKEKAIDSNDCTLITALLNTNPMWLRR
jgi:hypothetical protein